MKGPFNPIPTANLYMIKYWYFTDKDWEPIGFRHHPKKWVFSQDNGFEELDASKNMKFPPWIKLITSFRRNQKPQVV